MSTVQEIGASVLKIATKSGLPWSPEASTAHKILSVELIAPPGPPCPTCAGVGSVKVRYPDGWGRYTCADCGGCGATA